MMGTNDGHGCRRLVVPFAGVAVVAPARDAQVRKQRAAGVTTRCVAMAELTPGNLGECHCPAAKPVTSDATNVCPCAISASSPPS
jgi:hypothetical protein